MISFNREIGKAHVESHTFWEFLQEVQTLTLTGYTLCLENDYFPTQYIGYWSAHFDETGTVQAAGNHLGQVLGLLDALSEADLQEVMSAIGLKSSKFTEQANGPEYSDGPEFDGFDERVGGDSPAEVVNQQDADTADDITVAPAVPDEQPTEKPKRGRPRLTRDTDTNTTD